MSNRRRTHVYPRTDTVTQVQKAYLITGREAYGTSDVLEKVYKMVAVSRRDKPCLYRSFLPSRHNLLSPFVLFVCEWVHTCNLPFTHRLLRSFTPLCDHSVTRLALHSFNRCCCQLTTTLLPAITVTNLPRRSV